MAFSVDEFKGAVRKGIAVPNMFKVILPGLPGVISTKDLNLLCKDVNLPGRQILTTERTVGMLPHKVAYGFASDDISLTFHVLNDYGVKQYFEAWQNLVIAQNQPAYELSYFNDYTFDVIIQQLEKGIGLDIPTPDNFKIGGFTVGVDADILTNARVVYTCVLERAFPTTMNAIQFNNEQGGMIELNVQLSYKNWSSR